MAEAGKNNVTETTNSDQLVTDLQGLFDKAEAEYIKGNFDAAVGYLDKATQVNSISAEAFYNRGLVKFGMEKYGEAIADFTTALSLFADYEMAYLNRGIAYHRLSGHENYLKAIEDFNRVISLNPDYTLVYWYFSLVCGDMGRYEDAVKYLSKLIEHDGKALYFFKRGYYYNLMDKKQEAIIDYNESIRIENNNPDAYFNRGLIYHTWGRYEEAIADYSKDLDIDPQHSPGYFNRSKAYTQLGNYDHAIADLLKALELDPKDSEAYLELGIVYNSKNDFEQAITNYSKALEINPDLVNGYFNRGLAYFSCWKYREAIDDFTRVVEKDHADDEAFFYIAVSFSSLDEPDYVNALKNYNSAISLDRKNKQYFLERGRVYNNIKKYTEAKLNFDEALKLDEQFDEAYLLRGIARYEMNELDPALKDFDKAIQIKTDYYEAYLERGYCLNKLKRPDESISDLMHAYKLFPTNFLSLVDLVEILFVNGKNTEAEKYLAEALGLQWANVESAIFTFFSWLLKKIKAESAKDESELLTDKIRSISNINYNFNDIKDWLKDASLENTVKKEIEDMINKLDSLNRKYNRSPA